ERLAVEDHRGSEHTRRGVELRPPELMSEDRDLRTAAIVVTRSEEPSRRRRDTERREVGAGHHHAVDVTQRGAISEVEALRIARRERGDEDVLLISNGFPDRGARRRLHDYQ